VKTILIGEAQPRVGTRPWEGRSGRRLEKLIGLPAGTLHRFFDLRNALKAWPGHTGQRGDAFPERRAAKGLLKIVHGMEEGASAIVCSRRLALSIGLEAAPCTWVRTDAETYLGVLPHPSGVNRWWNDPKHRRDAAVFMKMAAAESWLNWSKRNDPTGHRRALSIGAFVAQGKDSPALRVARAHAFLSAAVRREMEQQ